ADRLGLATDLLQGYRYAAELAGVQQNTLEMALQRFPRRTAEAAAGTGEAKAALEQMGIALRDSSGDLRSTDDLLGDVSEALTRVRNPADRVRLALKLFDSEGVAMVNMLRDGRDGLEAMRAEARRLGLVLDEDLLRAAERIGDQLTTVNRVIEANLRAGLLSTLASNFGDLNDVVGDPGFQKGLQLTGAFIGQIAAEASRAVREIGALAQLFQNPSWEGLADFLTEGTVIGLGRRLLEGAGVLEREAESLAAANDNAAESFGNLGESAAGAGAAIAETADTIAGSISQMRLENLQREQLIGALHRSRNEHDALAEAIELENAAMRLGIDASTEQGRAWIELYREGQRLRGLYKELTEAEREQEAASRRAIEEQRRTVERAAEEQRRVVERSTDDVIRYAGDAFADLFEDTGRSWGDMWDDMVSWAR